MIVVVTLITVALFLILDFYISTKQYEGTFMKQETEFTLNTSDLIFLIRSAEYFIKSAKDAEKVMPKELKPASRAVIKQANKTLKKLKAIQTNNNKIFRGEK